MRIALISDIHANLSALEAVFADIDSIGVDTVYCLGDTVGYGPQPLECLDLVRERCSIVLLGNHEYAVLHGADNFTPLAAKAIDWTSSRLRDPQVLEFLSSLKPFHREGEILYVHASIKDPVNDYVREADSPWSYYQLINTLRQDFKDIRLCFVGHNHRTFLGTELGYIFPHDDCTPPRMKFNVSEQKAYISVGSVGQPRNNDPRASWVLWDGESVEYHRVEYDWRATSDLIIRHGLPKFLAQRLEFGE